LSQSCGGFQLHHSACLVMHLHADCNQGKLHTRGSGVGQVASKTCTALLLHKAALQAPIYADNEYQRRFCFFPCSRSSKGPPTLSRSLEGQLGEGPCASCHTSSCVTCRGTMTIRIVTVHETGVSSQLSSAIKLLVSRSRLTCPYQEASGL
jgi:hypothetical protein